MRATVIPSDHWIRRDDDSAYLPEWGFDDDHIHAIQWYETEGEVEYVGRPKPANEEIDSDALLLPYIDALEKHLAEETAVQ